MSFNWIIHRWKVCFSCEGYIYLPNLMSYIEPGEGDWEQLHMRSSCVLAAVSFFGIILHLIFVIFSNISDYFLSISVCFPGFDITLHVFWRSFNHLWSFYKYQVSRSFSSFCGSEFLHLVWFVFVCLNRSWNNLVFAFKHERWVTTWVTLVATWSR